MADFIYNVALGRGHEFAQRVESGDPTDARLLMVALVTTETDATLKDLDTLAAVLANGNTAEATNTNYARKTLTDSDVTITIDDSGNAVQVDIPDQTWSAVASGDNWTDLVICYIPDGVTPGADSTAIPISQHDFSVTPDGSDITAQINSSGFYQAS